jgi:hypothetical protein
LWTEQHLYFPSDYISVLESRSRDWVGDIGRRAQAHFPVCCHQHETGRDVAGLLDIPLIGSRRSPGSKHCDVCSTEYAFFIWEGLQKGSLHVALSTWVTLGTCRYTFSPAWLTSSWLSSSHCWLLSATSRPTRPFHNDNSAFYSDRTIARASASKRGNIIRPSNLVRRLAPSQFDEPKQMPGGTSSRLESNAVEKERSQSNETSKVPAVTEVAEVVEVV